jgi:hypothetical protein
MAATGPWQGVVGEKMRAPSVHFRESKSETNPNFNYQRLKTRATSRALPATWRHLSVFFFDIRVSGFEFL